MQAIKAVLLHLWVQEAASTKCARRQGKSEALRAQLDHSTRALEAQVAAPHPPPAFHSSAAA